MTRAELEAILLGLEALPYGGEPVDQLAHALQTAALALAEAAPEDLVLAALLHDIGRSPAVMARHPGLGHDRAGELTVEEELGSRIAWLVGSHAEAKRFLVTTDPGYLEGLSPASLASLGVQGGAMTPGETAAFRSHPWAADALRLRRWDDRAKIPGGPEADLGTLLDSYQRLRAAHRLENPGAAPQSNNS